MKSNCSIGEKALQKNSISGQKEISEIYKKGISRTSSLYTIIYRKNSFSFDRFAVLVSKKNGNAVKRNRIKRLYREVLRTNKRTHRPHFDLLILPKAGISPQQKDIKSAFLSWIVLSEKE